MQPIFEQQIKMWKELGSEVPIQEGTYWLDNGIIKGFNSETNKLCKLYRYKIENNLEISITKHKEFNKYSNVKFETWEETIKRMNFHLNTLEDKSISLLKGYSSTERKIINTNSTGKDSMVCEHLMKKADLTFETYFNVTTLDVGQSTKTAKLRGYNFTFPDKKYGGFYQMVKNKNIIPSRLNRFCCSIFKEGATINQFDKDERLLLIFGMRNTESNLRSKYTDIWVNNKWGNRDWLGILPIREWTELDVWLYILRENIFINDKYRMGYPRVGCAIACPNYSKSTWVLDKYWYPKMYERWQSILKEDFLKNNKWLIMNCTVKEYLQQAWNGGVFRTEPTEEVIQEYSIHNNLDFKTGRQYFSRVCSNGCLNRKQNPLKIKDKSVLGMNMKYFGRNVEKFKCKKCLMKEYGWTIEDWNQRVKDFKTQGCVLF